MILAIGWASAAVWMVLIVALAACYIAHELGYWHHYTTTRRQPPPPRRIDLEFNDPKDWEPSNEPPKPGEPTIDLNSDLQKERDDVERLKAQGDD